MLLIIEIAVGVFLGLLLVELWPIALLAAAGLLLLAYIAAIHQLVFWHCWREHCDRQTHPPSTAKKGLSTLATEPALFRTIGDEMRTKEIKCLRTQ